MTEYTGKPASDHPSSPNQHQSAGRDYSIGSLFRAIGVAGLLYACAALGDRPAPLPAPKPSRHVITASLPYHIDAAVAVAPGQDPEKGGKKAEPQPDPQHLLEKQMKEKIKRAEELFSKHNDKNLPDLDKIVALEQALVLFREAEALLPGDQVMSYYLKDRGVERRLGQLFGWAIASLDDPKQIAELCEKASKLYWPLLGAEIDQEVSLYEAARKAHKADPALMKYFPESVRQKIAAEQAKPEPMPVPKPEPQPRPEPIPTGSHYDIEPELDRIIVRGDVGAKESSQDRSIAMDANVVGAHVLAHHNRNKFREEETRDRIVEEGRGIYTKLDLERILGAPLDLSASFDERSLTRDSSSFEETDNPNFNIKTFTDTTTEEAERYLALSALLKTQDFRLGLTLFSDNLATTVDVLTRLKVINKLDPAGSYTDFIPSSTRLKTETVGGQLLFEYVLSDRVRLGTLFTTDLTDMKDQDRSIDRYRLHAFCRWLSQDKRYGISGMLGQGLLDDQGEENDEFTKGEYNFVAGAELSPWLTVASKFSYLEHPKGSLLFLLGKSDHALQAILENAWQENLSDLDLLKGMSQEQQRIYLLGRHADLVRALAQQNQWLFLGDAGAARVSRLDGDETVANLRGTLFMPITDDFTLTVAPYVLNTDLSERKGLEIGAYPKGSRWTFGFDVSQEETEGRFDKDEEFRGLFWARYAFGK